MPDASGHHLAYGDIRELQLAALNERFQERIDQIKLVKLRADDAGVTEIRTLQDVVPLLLPHTAYKSYPESFLTEKRWDRLTKWLGTVSTRATDNVDLDGVTEIDEWLERLGKAGHFVSCSSGTTGKSAMLPATQADLDFAGQDIVAQVQWGSDIRVGDQRTQVGFGATAYTPRNMATGRALMEAFVDTSKPRPDFGVPPITIGSITKMIELRKAIADGVAKPGDIARYEEDSAARQKALEQASVIAADEIIAKRHDRFYITSMWAQLHQIAVEVRNRGYSAKDFHPENAVFLGGGLKRAQLPADYKEFIYETFNLQPRFIYQMYGMQEVNSATSRCPEGQRYHVPPWMVCLPLNKDGDALAPGLGEGQVEGRAALVETGQRLGDGKNPYVDACIERMAKVSLQPPLAIQYQFKDALGYLDKKVLAEVVEQNFPNPRALDEWVPHTDHKGRRSFIRAFAPRLIHVLPGNAPAQGIRSIAQSALVKSVSLFKMASADPFSTVVFLRTMADIDPDHPVVRSMSAIYWRGGDEKVERALYRPQYFDKLVAWGGGDAINNVMKYIGPGFQLVSFDPKTSISMVGREAFATDETVAEAARLNAGDVAMANQEACVCSRFTFIEATPEEADRYCKILAEEIRIDRMGEGTPRPLEADLKEQIDVLRMMDDEYAVFGKADGRGLAIRSETPVDFHPLRKTSNVVCVKSLDEAMKYVNIATQTVGVYPFNRMAELRDQLASGGAQRVVRLGEAGPGAIGNPHDAMYPLHRFVHWMANEDGCEP